MEQIATYRSPYRNKRIENEKEMPKFLKKIIKQTIGCFIIFGIMLVANNFEPMKKSSIWQNVIYLLGYDINIEETCQTFSEALVHIKQKIPMQTEEKLEEKIVDEKEQMQIDVQKIKEITSVMRPVAGVATSRFGKRLNSAGEEVLHTGVDLDAEIGTPVKAAISGKVIEVKELEDSFGKFLRIENKDIITTYAHCSAIEVEVGEEIKQGEIIAYSGDTGNVTGSHLHFEITKSGRYVDPGFLLTYQ